MGEMNWRGEEEGKREVRGHIQQDKRTHVVIRDTLGE